MSQKNFVSFGDAETLMAELASAVSYKVDKVTGKGLSTNDYTDADKAIVDGVTSALAGKADISDVPTKTSDLSNDNGFINNLVNDLANYYKKSETYTQAEIDARIAAITTLDIQAVNTLPTEDISTTTIYLVPKQTPSSQDVKDEYINLDGTTSGWEHIGTTEIDLSNYVTTSDLTTALQSYVPVSQLTANDTPFRFGYDSNTHKYGYIINEGGADTVIPFKDCDSSEITVSAANQILSGYKDYDSNGNLITGTNAGYDAGVTQGEANMKDGVTVTVASHVINGYKARTSDGTLVTGSDAGYSAGVTQGHADRDSGVTVTDPYHILSGYKGRKSNGELVTGTNGGWDAGRTQGQADMNSGVTVTDPYHILSGYKGRKSNGELVTGTNGGWDAGRNQGQADMKWGVTVTDASQIVNGYQARNSSGTLITGTYTDVTHTVRATVKNEMFSSHWARVHINVTKDGNAIFDGSFDWRTSDGTDHKEYEVGTWTI